MSEHISATTSGGFLGQGQSALLQVGSAMGIAAVVLGVLIFVGSCFGFEAALVFSPLPLGLGSVGLVLTIVGAVISRAVVDTQVLAALFVNAFGLAGGLLEMAAWMRWPVLGASGAM